MRVHLFQLDIVWEDKHANHASVEALADSTLIQPDDLVVLPELFDTGFSFNLDTTIDDGTTRTFLETFARSRQVYLHGSLTARSLNGRGLNRVVVFNPSGELIAQYDKLHPFSYGREATYFEGGSTLASYTWKGQRGELSLAPFICYDLRFPEAFRAAVQLGASAFALGANWPAARHEHWSTLVRARAIECQAFVFAVNRVGADPTLTYRGGSVIVSPTGEVLAEAGGAQQVLSADIDPDTVTRWRAEFPALSDRRPDILAQALQSENVRPL